MNSPSEAGAEPDHPRDSAGTLTPVERQRIVERVRFENDVRDSLRPKTEPARKSLWDHLNSGLVLLLITSTVSAFLVPQLQSHQKELEWKRQLRTDQVQYRLGKMRECLNEFITAASLTSDAIEIGRLTMAAEPLSPADYRRFRSELEKLQKARFRQNGKVLGLLVYYREPAPLRRAVRDYIEASSRNIDTVSRYVDLRGRYPNDAVRREQPQGIRDRLDRLEADIGNPTPVTEPFDAAMDAFMAGIDAEGKRNEDVAF
jgi:hypothetical protein